MYIPKLVAELENFTKCVTQLSIKCKVCLLPIIIVLNELKLKDIIQRVCFFQDPSLTTNLKLTTTRDFRLDTKRLEEVMNQQEVNKKKQQFYF